MSFRVAMEATALLGRRSGVGNYAAELVRALLRADRIDCSVLLYTHRSLGRLEPAFDGAIAAAGRFAPSRWLWVHFGVGMLARRDGCHVLHCPNGMGPLFSPIPMVLTIHDLSLFRHPGSHPRRRVLFTGRLLPRLAQRAAAIAADSEFTRQEILTLLKIPAERVHTVHCAAGEMFAPVTSAERLAEVRQRWQLPEHFVLFVGTIEPRKNLHRLVRAFRQVKRRGFPHTLALAGAMGWQMAGLPREIEQLGLGEAVRLLGHVPDADLPALYSLADLFVYPSLYEGFGLPALEAMACGAPVLSSNGSALAEVCGEAACLIDPHDQEALGESMAGLLRDPERRADLRDRGLARARDFSWNRAARETLSLYRRAAAGRDPGAA